ncbi:MAG: hypothetical protein JST61_05445 [Acidobacteria bacterium]|nr:hypothetical protein [Acidobacteriota bacterium]
MQSCLARRIIGFLIATLTAASLPAMAQQGNADGMPIDSIILRLQIRTWEYLRNVPDFFADEMVISEVHGTGIPSMKTMTESVFRLRRGDSSIFPPVLFESRAVRHSSDPFNTDTVKGPALLIGGFSNGLATITLTQKNCFDLRIEKHGDLHHRPVFQLAYRLKQNVNGEECLPWPGASGKAIIDATTFNVLRFEMHVPDYQIVPNVRGPWRWSIDYTPVTLGGRVFTMPQHIVSNCESSDGKIVWFYSAVYRNYHKTDVHSRILTGLESNPNLP